VGRFETHDARPPLEAVQLPNAWCELEVSGGITLERLKTIARFTVDSASTGSLTQSAWAMDLSRKRMTAREPPKPCLRVR
jgi:nicotinate-nucleotide pyrophosphorylase